MIPDFRIVSARIKSSLVVILIFVFEPSKIFVWYPCDSTKLVSSVNISFVFKVF